MRLGLGAPIVQQVSGRAQAWESGAGPDELVRVAQEADRLGFAWISCSDHIAVPQSYAAAMGPVWYEPTATLAFLAAHTQRIGLLSHVLVLPYRHPLLVAKSFATLDRLSGGRVLLGVGAGHLKPEFRSLGIPYDERGRRSDEALRAIARALEDESSSFAGQHFAWHDMRVAPRPVRQPRPPLWVGGNGALAVRRAAALGDGWIPWEIDCDVFAERVRMLRDLGAAADFSVIAPASFALAETAAVFRERSERWLAAGANAFHVGIESRSLAHLLERMDELGGLVAGG